MQQTKQDPKLKRRNLTVMVVVVAVMTSLFAGGLSLIIFK